ncbi:MAG: hypothetical protein RL023_519 [Candidatus Parcubacteria bacterium]|jgi:hypothetical protein
MESSNDVVIVSEDLEKVSHICSEGKIRFAEHFPH